MGGANRPVNGYGHGQVSHQSVSKPFGAHAAVVADAPNRLHGADAVVSHGVHAVHAPVHHAVHAPIAHAVHAPVHHSVHAAPLLHHAAPVVAHAVHAPVHHAVHAAPAYHAPVVHAAPAYHAPVKAGYVADDLAEPSPYSYTYAVADDYSGAAFNQAENNDGTGVVDGSYSVNLPDGRIQHVKYHANDYDGFVAHAAPAYHAPVAHAVHNPVAHAVHAPVVPTPSMLPSLPTPVTVWSTVDSLTTVSPPLSSVKCRNNSSK